MPISNVLLYSISDFANLPLTLNPLTTLELTLILSLCSISVTYNTLNILIYITKSQLKDRNSLYSSY